MRLHFPRIEDRYFDSSEILDVTCCQHHSGKIFVSRTDKVRLREKIVKVFVGLGGTITGLFHTSSTDWKWPRRSSSYTNRSVSGFDFHGHTFKLALSEAGASWNGTANIPSKV